MNCLIYIILFVILVLCLGYFALDEITGCGINDSLDTIIGSIIAIDIIGSIIFGFLLLELAPYMVHKDNIKNVNQYESVMYELEHPEEFREIDRIHDVREWNDKYDSYVYSHDNNIFWGILYPLGDMEGTEHIDIEKYLGE